MTLSSADVAIIGGGVAGLSAALALADTGLDVVLLADVRAGEASPAAAGILDAGHGFSDPDTRRLMRFARDLWPAWLRMIADRTGVPVPFNRDGVLELAVSVQDADRLRAQADDDAEWLDAHALLAREPQLTHALGALRFVKDGAVNPLVLLKALKQAVARHVHVRVLQQTVSAIAPGRPDEAVVLTLGDGSSISAMRAVIAAGAWSAAIIGLPMHLPVSPLRGQLMSVASKALRHVVILGEGYAVPRGDGRTIIGGTEEHTGFDAQHTPDGAARVRTLAAAILPSLGTASMLSTWAGLRPMTSDGLPLIGPDAEHPSVLYACGHGKNGILLGPLTGALIAAMVTGTATPTDTMPFSPLRFS